MTRARWIGGIHPVAAALAAADGRVRRLWIDRRRDDARLRGLLEQAGQQGIAIERVHAEALARQLPELRHQGVAAEVLSPPLLDEAGVMERLDGLDHDPLVVVLDGVQDPHNLGACLRTAAAAGADVLALPKDRAVGITPVVERAAAGAAQCLPIARVTNLARLLDRLREHGCWVVGTAGEAERTLYQADLRGPLALVLGGEGKGLRPQTRKHCDDLVCIPLFGPIASLNVSVAAGVCLFEAARQRHAHL